MDVTYAVGFAKYLLNELGILAVCQYIIEDKPETYREALREQFRKISELRSADVTFSMDVGEKRDDSSNCS